MHLFFICMELLVNELKPEDRVKQLFDNKRSTLSLGYIGLYEVASVFLWRRMGEKS